MEEKEYSELAKKYKLPSFRELDRMFNISEIEQKENPAANIRKKMLEQIEPALEFVEHLLQPDPNMVSDMYECKYVNAEDKTHLFSIYKKLMKTLRTHLELELRQEDKEDCHFIAAFAKEWSSLKEELLPFVIKIKTSWSEPSEAKEKLEYLG